MQRDALRKIWEKSLGIRGLDALVPDQTARPLRVAETLAVEGDSPSVALPGYEAAIPLAHGGMGTIWRAHQQSLNRDVAIKRAIQSDNSAAQEQFRSEALISGALEHPNIVPIHDLAKTESGEYFLSMKLVSGRVWRDVLPDQRLEDAVGVLVSVCHAVAYAHTRGIVHRDIKPSNVMIGDFGEVLLMDWGLAVDVREGVSFRLSAPRHHITAASGTPAYMPPEMAEGRGEEIGRPSDVYLLGATLHEILTGAPPHSGATVLDVLHAASLSFPKTYPVEIPKELSSLCSEAMDREPERRPTAVEFRERLNIYLQHRESNRLTSAAIEGLLGCVDRAQKIGEIPESERDLLYEDFAAAVSGFHQALELWPENERARDGQQEGRRAYAEAALKAGDLGLASAQAGKIQDGSPLTRDLQRNIQQATAARRRSVQTTRVLRWSLALAVGLLIAGLTVGTVMVNREARRTEQGMKEILRLSDVRRLSELASRADDLWPARAEQVPEMQTWLEDGQTLIDRLPEHQRTLLALREKALPYGVPDQTADREHHPAYPTLLALTAEIAEKQGRLEGDASLGQELQRLRAEQTRLEQEISPRKTWRMRDEQTQWEHDALTTLVEGLERLRGDAPDGVTLHRMQARLAYASSVLQETVHRHRELWEQTSRAVASSPLYHGLTLQPQVGLVPLGPDPQTGLMEFADPETGTVPHREADGHLALSADMAMVFVLLPGGSFRMGAVRNGEGNLDPEAAENESPITMVRLDPFFLSKYETTQGQWLHVTGQNPAQYPPDSDQHQRNVSLLLALENVSYEEADTFVRRLALQLPTEAQWEYAYRAGSTTPYPTGAELSSIQGFMNVADRYALEHGRLATGAYETWLDDGYRVEAPVGSYLPNAFGIHDMGGNVLEWCRDRYGSYKNVPRPVDGLRVGDSIFGTFVHRGGNWFNTGSSNRSAIRDADSPDSKWDSLGFRAARGVE